MQKIPTIYLRDWDGMLGPPGKMVTDERDPRCDWVFNGEGQATQKLDGTCCMVKDGRLWRRHEVNLDKRTGQLKQIPEGFVVAATDETTGEFTGWVPVGEGPADQYHRLAFERQASPVNDPEYVMPDGTYELIGPHVNGNPEHMGYDYLYAHAGAPWLKDVPTGWAALRDYFLQPFQVGQKMSDHSRDIEGVVWHHPDGRMAKIKGRDFGIKRPAVPTSRQATVTP